MDIKTNQNKISPEVEEAIKLFAQTFRPADEIANADLVKSMHEMKDWFLDMDLEVSGLEICEHLKKFGFEMKYTGGMYLFLLKNY